MNGVEGPLSSPALPGALCVLAYGPRGAGKTHLFYGPGRRLDKEAGLVFRAAFALFSAIEAAGAREVAFDIPPAYGSPGDHGSLAVEAWQVTWRKGSPNINPLCLSKNSTALVLEMSDIRVPPCVLHQMQRNARERTHCHNKSWKMHKK